MDLTNLNKDRKARRKGSPLELNTMMYGKVPPQAKDLEESVLGAIMLEKTAFDEIDDILKPEIFYVEAHQRIYATMIALKNKNQPIDLLTVVEELKFREELDLVGGPYYVSKLTNSVVSTANIIAHARIIIQKFLSRELIRVAGQIIGDAYEDSTDVFELQTEAERMILELGNMNSAGQMKHITQVCVDAVNAVEKWRLNDTHVTGTPSGFPEIDRATRGWQPGDLIILAARPSVGKTALLLNIARNAALDPNKPCTVGIWSLEMDPIYLALRMMAAESKVLLHVIQSGRLSQQQMDMVLNAVNNVLAKANIYFDDSSTITIRSFSAQARRLKKQATRDGRELGLIMIDYMQLMSGDEKSGNREQEMAYISRNLKRLAKELKVPIIALSQLTRGKGVDNITWDQGPPVTSLRESGAIEQDADMIMMLWGATDKEIEENPAYEQMRKLRIAKQRNGVTITTTINFRNEIQFFQSAEKALPSWTPVAIDYTEPRTSNDDNISANDIDNLPF